MPKIVSDHEKEMIQEAIYLSTIQLIQKKGLKGITVDDITGAAGIAKGSFYKYYPSKEECIYEVARRSERELFGRIETALSQSITNKDLIISILHEVYLASDSLVLYVNPKEIEVLIRKLPVEYAEREQKKSENYFERTLELMGLNRKIVRMGVIGYLMDSLAFIASKNTSSESQEAMEMIIDTIADYMVKGLSKKAK